MGVRYNAEKKAIGNFFSAKIFQFRMRCHLCDGWIEIHTDPENSQYVVASGGQRKTETFEPTEDDRILLTSPSLSPTSFIFFYPTHMLSN